MNDAHALEKKVIWLMALIQFINAVDFMIVMPLGADFASALHMSAANIGYLGGGYTLAAAVSSCWWRSTSTGSIANGSC